MRFRINWGSDKQGFIEETTKHLQPFFITKLDRTWISAINVPKDAKK